jgi:hypothetical protein
MIQVKTTDRHPVSADDGSPKPIPFTVYEVYAYRSQKPDRPVLIEDAMLPSGELRLGFAVVTTTSSRKGFRLCDPTPSNRAGWERMVREAGCQIPGKLIIFLVRTAIERDEVWPVYAKAELLRGLLGRDWQWCFGS